MTSIFKDLAKAPEAVWREVESSAKRVVDWLVERGQLSSEDARMVMSDMTEKSSAFRSEWEDRVDKFINERVSMMQPPNKEKLSSLRQRVNNLINRVDRLEETWQEKNASRED